MRKRHVCPICSKVFKRSAHCARHERSRHTQDTPFRCRYCQKPYRRSDTVVRHEKAAHEKAYSRRITPDKAINSLPTPEDTPRHPYGSHADSREPSPVESEDKTTPPIIERPVPICRLHTCPSSPNQRISEALIALDFTTLHSEALSANHMTVQDPKPPSETELTQRETVSGSSTSLCTYKTPSMVGNDFNFAIPTPPLQSPTPGQPRHRDLSSQYHVPLPLGVMFDPLWNPDMTRKAAVSSYAFDLHRKILRNHGLL